MKSSRSNSGKVFDWSKFLITFKVFYTSFCRYIIVVSDDVGHSSMLASVELIKRENRDDLDFLQMNG
jgi:hypothetical protein